MPFSLWQSGQKAHPLSGVRAFLSNGHKRIGQFYYVPFPYFNSLRSCSFLPNSSSAASFTISFCKPSTRNTLKYAPNVTLASPFSIRYSVERAIPARSATWIVVSLRRFLASLIFSPICSNNRLYLGKTTCFLLLIYICD